MRNTRAKAKRTLRTYVELRSLLKEELGRVPEEQTLIRNYGWPYKVVAGQRVFDEEKIRPLARALYESLPNRTSPPHGPRAKRAAPDRGLTDADCDAILAAEARARLADPDEDPSDERFPSISGPDPVTVDHPTA